MVGPCFLSWDLCNPWAVEWFLRDDAETQPATSELVRQQSQTTWEDLQVDWEGLVAVVS